MPQELLNFPAVDQTLENWDALLQATVSSVISALKSFKVTLFTAGDTSHPTRVIVQLIDAVGNNVNQNYYIRCRVVNSGGYTPATHATLDAFLGGRVEILTTDKDCIFYSDASGKIILNCYDTTAESFDLLLGQPPLGAIIADFTNRFSITHIAPVGIENALNQQVYNVAANPVFHS